MEEKFPYEKIKREILLKDTKEINGEFGNDPLE